MAATGVKTAWMGDREVVVFAARPGGGLVGFRLTFGRGLLSARSEVKVVSRRRPTEPWADAADLREAALAVLHHHRNFYPLTRAGQVSAAEVAIAEFAPKAPRAE